MNALPHTMLFTSNLDEVLSGLEHSDDCVSQKIQLSDLVLCARTARLVELLTALFDQLQDAGMTREELLESISHFLINNGWEDDIDKALRRKFFGRKPAPLDDAGNTQPTGTPQNGLTDLSPGASNGNTTD